MIQAKDPVKVLNTRGRTALAASRERRQCIEFLIEVSETDPSELVSSDRPGDVLNFVRKLYRFGLMSAMVMDRVDLRDLAGRIEAHPKRSLGPLIENIRTLLDATADGKQMSLPLPTGSRLRFNAEYRRQMEQAFREYPPQVVHRMHPPFLIFTLSVPSGSSLSTQLAVFIFHAMRQLDSEEGAMVRRCRREGCRRVFLAGRPKQIFCTRKCASVVAFERHAKKPGYAEKHRKSARKSAQARRAYEKKQSRFQQNLEARGETNG